MPVTASMLEPHRDSVSGWLGAGRERGRDCRCALRCEHELRGRDSAVYQLIVSIQGARPLEATVVRSFGASLLGRPRK